MGGVDDGNPAYGPLSVDADTLRRARRGDALAIDELLSRISPYVGRICGAIALDDGQDAAQEALLIVFRKLGRLRDPRALAGWVRMIATREALRVARRRGTVPLEGLPDPSGPGGEVGVDIRAVLERLSPDHRAVLVLHAYEDLGEREIARVLGLSRGTVKSRLHRARQSFREEWRS
jgi:RNA polymerase sigma-70 factor (ECF subfamily)